jgi:hypothetical protein
MPRFFAVIYHQSIRPATAFGAVIAGLARKKSLDEMSLIYLWYANSARQMRNINGRQP